MPTLTPDTITGRVVNVKYVSVSRNGNPRYEVTINASPDDDGVSGEKRTTDRYAAGATHCYTCRRTWTEPTPSARCPWEGTHEDTYTVRTGVDSGLAYGIDNPEYRDDYHVYTISRGSIRTVTRA